MAFQTGQKLLIVLLLSSLATASPILGSDNQDTVAKVDKLHIPFTNIENYLNNSTVDLEQLLDDIKHRSEHNMLLSHGPLFPEAIRVLESIRAATLKFLDDFNLGKKDDYKLKDRIPCHYHYEAMLKEYENAPLFKLCINYSRKEIFLTIQSDVNCFLSSLYHLNSHLQTILFHYGWNKMVNELTQKLDTLADDFQDLSDTVTEQIEHSCMNYSDTASLPIVIGAGAGAAAGAMAAIKSHHNGSVTVTPVGKDTQALVSNDTGSSVAVAHVVNDTQALVSNDTGSSVAVAHVVNDTHALVSNDTGSSVAVAHVVNDTQALVSNDTGSVAVAPVVNDTHALVSNDTGSSVAVAHVVNDTQALVSNDTGSSVAVAPVVNDTQALVSNDTGSVAVAPVVTTGPTSNKTEATSVEDSESKNDTMSLPKVIPVVSNTKAVDSDNSTGNSTEAVLDEEMEILEKEKASFKDIATSLINAQKFLAHLKELEEEEEDLVKSQEESNGTEVVNDVNKVLSTPDNNTDNEGMLESLKKSNSLDILEKGEAIVSNTTEKIIQNIDDTVIDVLADTINSENQSNVTPEVKTGNDEPNGGNEAQDLLKYIF